MYNFLYVQFNLLHLYKYYYMQIICTIYVYDNKDIYKLYINSGDVMLIWGGENLFTKPSYFYHNTNGLLIIIIHLHFKARKGCGGGVIKIYVIQQD